MTFPIDFNEALRSITSVPAIRRRMARSFFEASAEGRHVTVLVLGVDNLELVSEARGVPEDQLMRLCRHQLDDPAPEEPHVGDGGLRHAYRDGARLVVLFERPLEDVEQLARRTILAARRLHHEDRRIDLSLSAGVAENRVETELYFETLVSVAEEGLAVARARGGECCVHTMLYRSLQDMEERDESALSGRPRIARRNTPKITPAGASATPASEPVEDGTDQEARLEPAPTPRARPEPPENESKGEPREASPDGPEERTHLRARPREAPTRALADLRSEFEKRLEKERTLRRQLEEAAGSGTHVERLELRIRKLSRSLEVTEERLRKVCKMKDIDPGVASIYREVQGLSGEDQSYAVKEEMMKNIFEANMLIQKQAG